MTTVEGMLAGARAGVHRPAPVELQVAQQAGAVVVDIRPDQYRAAEGEIPGSLVLERNVLEWRFDRTAPSALPLAGRPVIVVCNEGYASSLAAAALRELGVEATDLDGGYRAWYALGLPTYEGGPTPAEEWVPRD